MKTSEYAGLLAKFPRRELSGEEQRELRDAIARQPLPVQDHSAERPAARRITVWVRLAAIGAVAGVVIAAVLGIVHWQRTAHGTQNAAVVAERATQGTTPSREAVSTDSQRPVLRGTIRFGDEGRARFVTLTALNAEEGRTQETSTKVACAIGEDGTYEMSKLPEGDYSLSFAHDGYFSTETNVHIAYPETTVDIAMAPRAVAKVTGTVMLPGGKKPAEGIAVALLGNQGRDRYASATTDRDGRFVLTAVEQRPGDFGELRIDSDGHARIGRRLRGKNVKDVFKLVLEPAGNIAGFLRTESGEAAAGVRLSAYSPGEYYHYLSEPSSALGAYVISNVAASHAYELYTKSESFMEPYDSAIRRAPTAVVAGQTAVQDIIVRPVSIFLVRATDEVGRPVPEYDVDIRYVGSKTEGFGQACIQHEAEWAKLPLDAFQRTRADRAEFTATTATGESETFRDVPLSGERTNRLSFAIRNTSPSISGVVLLSGGAPATNAMVVVDGGVPRHHSQTRTDSSGMYAVRGFSAGSGLRISCRDLDGDGQTVTNVPAGTRDLQIVISRSLVVSGRVLYEESGAPVTNYLVERIGFKKRVRNADGRFSVKLPDYALMLYMRPLVVYINVDGYPLVTAECIFDRDGTSDVGDVLVGRGATVRGRVVNHEGVPMLAGIGMTRADVNDRIARGLVETAADDGSFVITNIAPGKAQFRAYYALAEMVYSGVVELKPGADVVLPDLVIATTGRVPVKIQFITPNGAPAAKAFVWNWHAFADEAGVVNQLLPFREYNDVQICTRWSPGPFGEISAEDADTLYSESFAVTPSTKSLRVRLHAPTKMTGTFTIDGKPVTGNMSFFQPVARRRHSTRAIDGWFEVDALPGMYLVNCQEKHVGGSVELRADGPSEISLHSGTAFVGVALPFQAAWVVHASLKCGPHTTIIAVGGEPDMSASAYGKVDRLPAGEYTIGASCLVDGVYTNFTKDITLGDGERKEITL